MRVLAALLLLAGMTKLAADIVRESGTEAIRKLLDDLQRDLDDE